MNDCVFCQIIAGTAPATVKAEYHHSIVIEPLNPVTPGHLLVIPRKHMPDFTSDAYLTSIAMSDAAIYAHRNLAECNLITSRGPAATQTVFHLHVHLVPRRPGDGLALPWSVG